MRKDGQLGDTRRERLLSLLKGSKVPIKAADLAEASGVSRQVIVQDMALLRARSEPVMATPQGYIYLKESPQPTGVRQTILSRHLPADTEMELNILVDHGITVLDVGVEHSIYGRIFRPLGLKTRVDVKDFIQEMAKADASLLSSLTGGVHLHTLEASNQGIIDQACQELAKHGFLA